MMAKAALAANRYLEQGEGDLNFYRGKMAAAVFYGDQLLPQAWASAETVMAGDATLAGLDEVLFAA